MGSWRKFVKSLKSLILCENTLEVSVPRQPEPASAEVSCFECTRVAVEVPAAVRLDLVET